MSQQMYAFEPQTFADSGFYLRALRVLCGKQVFPGSQFHAAIRKKKFGRRVARGNPELSGFPMQTNNCFPLLATGGPPGVIQRRGVGRQRRNA